VEVRATPQKGKVEEISYLKPKKGGGYTEAYLGKVPASYWTDQLKSRVDVLDESLGIAQKESKQISKECMGVPGTVPRYFDPMTDPKLTVSREHMLLGGGRKGVVYDTPPEVKKCIRRKQIIGKTVVAFSELREDAATELKEFRRLQSAKNKKQCDASCKLKLYKFKEQLIKETLLKP